MGTVRPAAGSVLLLLFLLLVLQTLLVPERILQPHSLCPISSENSSSCQDRTMVTAPNNGDFLVHHCGASLETLGHIDVRVCV